jgi:DNA-binding NarL/FixJ family response regulator
VGDGTAWREIAAQKNWAMALQTYRTALTTYRRYLETRGERETGPMPFADQVPLARASQPVPPPSLLEGLTPREREVVALVARGYSNQQIADALVLTRGTVANHVAHVLCKLDAANRTQVAARVFERAALAAENGAAVDTTSDPPQTPRLAVLPPPEFAPTARVG